MDQAVLIEDILTTKNTLTILHRVFIVNRTSLEQFSSIFNSIAELIDLLTYSSAKQIETALQSTGSQFVFNKLKDTLNQLSDAITTKNTSTINSLNEQLSSSVQILRKCSPDAANNEETADNIFKKQLLQQQIDTKTPTQVKHSDVSQIPVSHFDDAVVPELQEEKVSIVDPFAQFRFARRRRSSTSSKENEEPGVSDPSPQPPPPLAFPSSSKPFAAKPRLMISYNHASKPLCLEIYNCLSNDGYEVWIDFKQMHGSTLVAMAQGVESSDIFLYCVTENYSQSTSCQKEAEYAFIRQKIMIPLLLQAKYKPMGWLGLLLGATLYIDFTKGDFTHNYQKLKSEIESNSMRIDNNQNDVAKLTFDSTTNAKETTHVSADNPPLQSPKTNSPSTVKQSRSCVLF